MPGTMRRTASWCGRSRGCIAGREPARLNAVLRLHVCMLKLTRRGRTGFTLVELLVSIAIILIILTIAIPGVMSAKMNADETAVMREVQTIQQAQMQYQSQFGKYAANLGE